jgi:hypothetical protein
MLKALSLLEERLQEHERALARLHKGDDPS